MILEIAGVSTANKGAELMLQAILEHYSRRADLEFAVTRYFGPYRDRAQYGLRTKLDAMRFGRSRLAAALMPASFRQGFGLAAETDIAAVIDASGFAFSDQLGPQRTEEFARDVTRWKRQGKPVVLLPQAFGPFETPRLRRAMQQVVQQADLIYARDTVSLEHIRGVSAAHANVRLAPDFTCLVEAVLPEGFEPQSRQACIVPNHRMIEKTNAADRDRYIPFLATCVRELERRELRPYVLLHDSRVDESLVAPLEREVGRKLPVVRENDPRKLKGILGTAHVVIGSRFHALVSALSQAVPCLAVGWSHKYEALLADYRCPDCRLTPTSTEDEIRTAIGMAVDEGSRTRLITDLKRAAVANKEQASAMWRDVDAALRLSPPSGSTVGQHPVHADACDHVSA